MSALGLATRDLAPVTFDRPSGPLRVRTKDDTALVSARMGSWLRDADGVLCEGAPGVLVDEALGFAAVGLGPAGQWSVATDLSLELLGARIEPDDELSASSRCVHRDEALTYAECEVVSASGRVVARATQRGRWIQGEPESLQGEAAATGRARDVTGLWGIEDLAAGPEDLGGVALTVDARTRNLLGSLHGGVSLTASMLAAKRALRGTRSAGLAPLSAHLTYPRPTRVGERIEYRVRAQHLGRSFAVLSVAGVSGGTLRTMAQVTAHPVA